MSESEQSPAPKDGAREGLLPRDFRPRALAAQVAALPGGSIVATCNASLGRGGLGHHLAEIAEAALRSGQPCTTIDAASLPSRREGRLWRIFAARTPSARSISTASRFDEYAARQLPRADSLLAFNRQALAQLHVARDRGFTHRGLIAASPHAELRAERHAAALRAYPIEESFATEVPRRLLDEYAAADALYPASRYTLESFTERGFDAARMPIFPLTPDERFTPGEGGASADTFDVVYVGALTVAKGVPLLVDAFRALPHTDLRLRLVGAPKSRGMHRWLGAAISADARISAEPGDPLPVYRAAALCAHPAYEDGFAYSPAEALACGVPAVVSADTGMKELIEPGVNGALVPTGEVAPLREAIEAAYRRELVRGRPAEALLESAADPGRSTGKPPGESE